MAESLSCYYYFCAVVWEVLYQVSWPVVLVESEAAIQVVLLLGWWETAVEWEPFSLVTAVMSYVQSGY